MSKSLPKLADYNRQGRHTFSHPATGPFKVIRCDVADPMRDELTERIAELEAERNKWEWVATHFRGWDFDGPDKVGDRREQSRERGDMDEVEWLLLQWEARP